MDIQKDGKTAYEKRFSVPFSGPLIPFGSSVDYKPSSENDSRRTHEFAASVSPGLFMGSCQQAGSSWNGDLLILDVEELTLANSASELFLKRTPAPQVNIIKTKKNAFRFPVLEN